MPRPTTLSTPFPTVTPWPASTATPRPTTPPPATPTPLATATPEARDLAETNLYENETFGFSISYPTDWTFGEGSLSLGEVVFFAQDESGVERLPRVSVVIQDEGDPLTDDGRGGCSYVPVDPCQPMIEALRVARSTGVGRAWVDLEVAAWEPPVDLILPDSYPLPETGLEAFAAACLPVLPSPEPGSQRDERIRHMAHQLHLLELDHRRIVFVCALADWPWVRQAYHSRSPYPQPFGRPQMPNRTHLAEDSLYFLLGEHPYLTFLYEHRRAEEVAGQGDASETIDGVRTLLIETRDRVLRSGSDETAGPAVQQASSLTPPRSLFASFASAAAAKGDGKRADGSAMVFPSTDISPPSSEDEEAEEEDR